MSTGGARRWVRSGGVLWRRTPAAVILLVHDSGEPFSLTGSGRALWELLSDPLDESELCRRLADQHGTDVIAIAPDVHETLAALARRGAVSAQP